MEQFGTLVGVYRGRDRFEGCEECEGCERRVGQRSFCCSTFHWPALSRSAMLHMLLNVTLFEVFVITR